MRTTRVGTAVAILVRIATAVSLVVLGPAATGWSGQAQAAGTICVGLVVDFAELGGVDSDCVTVPDGSTGYDVLTHGGHTFEVCRNGVLGSIDGQPANGCSIKDDTHYWTYWHRAPGSSSWTYSSEGAGTYAPDNASTEGWRWRGGGTLTPPAGPSYSSICKPSPTPTPMHTSADHHQRHTRAPAAGTPTPTAATTSRPASTAQHSTSPRPGTTVKAVQHTRSPASRSAVPAPTGTAPAPAGAMVDQDRASGDKPPYALFGALAAIALLAVAGAVRAWRRRRFEP